MIVTTQLYETHNHITDIFNGMATPIVGWGPNGVVVALAGGGSMTTPRAGTCYGPIPSLCLGPVDLPSCPQFIKPSITESFALLERKREEKNYQQFVMVIDYVGSNTSLQ